uniref:Uncharacterized protein n=1 Tax=Minutocellus polymorphus TaxID=265543 RepID=A0A7S0AXU0_9STRA|mmetsp:Transcript_6524/g.10884  ORF Transcript_6524/g.10884 Transcript_6524/m.10884 type:complete len:201 (+) Transcript_6524:52-654(+)
MKVVRSLSAASVAVALSPAVVTAFSPGVTRRRNYGGGHFAQVVSPLSPITVLLSEAIPLDSSGDHHRHLSPAQFRAEAEQSSQAFYRRSQHTDPEWADMLETDPLLSHIRSELISKYVALGSQWSQAEATKEVDTFLNDEDRSGEFIEMRRYAFVHREEEMGFEDAMLFAAAFVAGVGVDLAMRWGAEHIDGFTMPFFLS